MSKDPKDMTGAEYERYLFNMITRAVCPSATPSTQLNAVKTTKNREETMSKPECGSDDCRKAVAKAESLVRKAIIYKEKHGLRENLGYDSDTVLDEFMESLNLSYSEKVCIRNYFYNLCGKI